MKIRPFAPGDEKAVITLWEDCSLTRPWNNPALDIQRKMKLDDGLFLVGLDHETIVASVMAGYDGHRGWINYLAVSPALQKSGIGRQMMQAAEVRLLALGCPKINLQIRHGNDAVIAFYESLGFCEDKCVSYGKRLIADN